MLVWIRFDGLPRKCMHILGGQSLTRQRSYRLHSFHPFLESCVSRRSLMKKIHIVFQSEISENDDKDREPHSRQILQFQNFPARIRRTCRLANPFLNLLVRLDKHPPKLSARESGFKFTCKAWTGVLISRFRQIGTRCFWNGMMSQVARVWPAAVCTSGGYAGSPSEARPQPQPQ